MQTVLGTTTLQNTVRAYPGAWMFFRLTAKETNGELSVVDIRMRPGAEPPRHIHEWEDETIIIHEGTATFFIGNEILNAKKGDTIFMPRNVAHHFVITSESAYCTLVTTPGGIENFFNEITYPFHAQFIPAAERPTEEAVNRMTDSMLKFGMSLA